MKLQKTPTERKHEKLLRQLGYGKNKKQVKKKSKPYEGYNYLKTLSYIDFLNTRYWKHVRKLVLVRDGHKCIICNGTDTLQVHHDTYKHHLDELNHLGDLMTLCRVCHKEHHMAR